jgi:hypothetical protein
MMMCLLHRRVLVLGITCYLPAEGSIQLPRRVIFVKYGDDGKCVANISDITTSDIITPKLYLAKT